MNKQPTEKRLLHQQRHIEGAQQSNPVLLFGGIVLFADQLTRLSG
jgi:hypothetical protein